MTYNLHSFVFFIIFMIYFHHTLAFDRWITELVTPSPVILLSCEEWITFYNLTDDGVDNREKSLRRRRENDKHVHVWTVSYALYLASFNFEPSPFGPSGYCQLYLNQTSYMLQYYKPLKMTTMTCEDWIFFSGYYNQMPESTRLNAVQLRNIVEDNYNSIWTTSYVRFIHKDPKRASIDPEDFCGKIGKNNPLERYYHMDFMNKDATLLTCEEWIKIYGFSDNITGNLQKAANQRSEYDETMNKWAKSYIQFLRNSENSDDVIILNTPSDYCKTTFRYTIEAIHFEYES